MYFWFFLPRIFNDALNIKEVKIFDYTPAGSGAEPQKPTKFEHLMAKWSVFLVLFTSHFNCALNIKEVQIFDYTPCSGVWVGAPEANKI